MTIAPWKSRCQRRHVCEAPCGTCAAVPRRPDACYLAGPMSGYPEMNAPAFRAAAASLRALGFTVVSPLELGEAHFGHDPEATTPEEYLRLDLRELATRCTQIALLPGWMGSIGANVEVAVAIALGFAFFDAESGAPMARPRVAAVTRGYRDPAPHRFFGPRGQPMLFGLPVVEDPTLPTPPGEIVFGVRRDA